MPATRPLSERFWEKVDKRGPLQPGMRTRCWVWCASRDVCGYGWIGLGQGRRLGKAHRVAWEMKHGEIPDGLYALHRCDNPSCVRVSHLFLGTQKDNANDRERKGRGNHAVGSRHWTRKNPQLIRRGDQHWTRLHPGAHRGEGNPRARLTRGQVLDIRTKYARGGLRYADLATEYNVDVTTVGNIVRRETWT